MVTKPAPVIATPATIDNHASADVTSVGLNSVAASTWAAMM
jgi:hypothetical protein